MPDYYQQSQVTGTSYRRCNRVEISNELGHVPRVRFAEETITVLPDRTLHEPTEDRPTGISVPVDPTRVIAERDRATGALTGRTMTYGELAQWVSSAYLLEAFDEDAKQAEAARIAAEAAVEGAAP